MIRVSTGNAPTDHPSPLAIPAKRTRSREPHVPPFTIIVDTREQTSISFEGLFDSFDEEVSPYEFIAMNGRSKQDNRPIAVKTKIGTLATGDYSIEGMQELVTVERKSLTDLYGTLASGRERFEREHERMKAMSLAGGRACVVIEASFSESLETAPVWSNLHPNSVFGYAVSWPSRYLTPWVWAGGRRGAEEFTYRFLEMFWREQQKNKEEHQPHPLRSNPDDSSSHQL